MNAIHWFEIPAADFDRAVNFYETILAARLTPDRNHPGMHLAIFPYEKPGIGGCIISYPQARPHADGVRIYLNGGTDLGVILSRVVAAGGQITMPKTLLNPEIGYIGMFSDPEGNVIGLHSLH